MSRVSQVDSNCVKLCYLQLFVVENTFSPKLSYLTMKDSSFVLLNTHLEVGLNVAHVNCIILYSNVPIINCDLLQIAAATSNCASYNAHCTSFCNSLLDQTRDCKCQGTRRTITKLSDYRQMKMKEHLIHIKVTRIACSHKEGS